MLMKLHTLNGLQLVVMERQLSERLTHPVIAECAVLYGSVKSDLDAVQAERKRRQKIEQAA